jgi:hypothetical protein
MPFLAWLVHAYNPSYSGGRDQEDHSSKPARGNIAARPYLKKTLHKNRAGGVAQGEGPEFKFQTGKENNNKNHLTLFIFK